MIKKNQRMEIAISLRRISIVPRGLMEKYEYLIRRMLRCLHNNQLFNINEFYCDTSVKIKDTPQN